MDLDSSSSSVRGASPPIEPDEAALDDLDRRSVGPLAMAVVDNIAGEDLGERRSESTYRGSFDRDENRPYNSYISRLPISRDEIRRRYSIPRAYKIVIPSVDQRVDTPPPGCISIFLGQLINGLRFPIAQEIVNILKSMRVLPAQLTPNSYGHLIGFMMVMKYRSYYAGLSQFWCLFEVAARHGFYHVKARHNNKFLFGEASGYGKDWKTRYFYVQESFAGEFECFGSEWLSEPKISIPRGIREPAWPDNFVLQLTTDFLYNVKRLVEDRVLSLAGLSPVKYTGEMTFGN